MLKVMTIVGTRPELIKMSRVIAEFDQHTHHVLVHTGQNYDYELNQIFFEDLGIRKPDYFLDAVGENAVQTIARVIEKSDSVMGNEKPDAVMLYGDTNSCLAVIAAKRRKIPVFHMEAGNRCFDQRVPEELNRKVVDHLSDINMVLTEHARRYLLAEGIRGETIIKTGSHMREVLNYYKPHIDASEILSKLDLQEKSYFLVSIHREENVDSTENLVEIIRALNGLAQEYKVPIIVSTHPRTRKRLDAMDSNGIDPLIQFLKPFGFLDYIKLQLGALCVLSDSGTITEETALLNLSAVTLRQAHERPEGMDAGTLIMAGIKSSSVLDAVRVTISQYDANFNRGQVVDYAPEDVSRQVLKIVHSYIDYVNRTVWSKDL
ncbi:MAG: UDP-N-acetylglucosamine 2-epimerase (non-hydrolyzing) [Oxalobacter sp.]|nr:MAG: UDP-N-acetylglucosamine 2-epimerase (non-hydrolyzing) [Oxalobacter sp.]